jgi:transcription initiation factor IIE alpha subunit
MMHNDVTSEEMVSEHVNTIVIEIVDSVWKIISDNIPHVITESAESSGENVRDNLKVSNGRPKIFPCPACGKLFSQFPSASKHCKVEHVTLSTNCPKCGKTIQDKKNIKRHMKTCTGAMSTQKKQSNKCDGCGKTFSSKQRLDYHMVSKHGAEKLETTETQFMKCPECTFSHPKLSVVKVHISKIHTLDVKLNCAMCDYSCHSKSGMWKHIAKVHKTNTDSEFVREEISESLTLVGQGLVSPPAAHSVSANHVSLHAPQYAGGYAPTQPEGHVLPLVSPYHVDHAYQHARSYVPQPPADHAHQHAADQSSEYHARAYHSQYAAGNVPPPAAQGYAPGGLVQHNASYLVQNSQLSASDSTTDYEFLAQNFDGRNYFEQSRIHVTDDGKTLLNL